MAPKRRMPTRANPEVPDMSPVDVRESTGESAAAPDVAHIAQGMDQMRRSIDRLVDLLARQPPPPPLIVPEQQPAVAQPVPPSVGTSQSVMVSFAEFHKMHPPTFSGVDSAANPSSFIEESHRICKALGCTSVRSVELVSFQLKDIAYEWFVTFCGKRGDVPLAWPEFSEAFLARFLPKSVRDARAREFEHLEQTDQMTVSEYDIQFTRLCRFAPHLVSTERLRVERFVNGLKDYLFRSIQITDSTTYPDVLDAALRLEYRTKESRAKREAVKKSKSDGAGKSQSQRGIGRAQNEPVLKNVPAASGPRQ